ncbi:MAG: biotin/lipoyl-binding protein, partial [Bacteroidota bacterium]
MKKKFIWTGMFILIIVGVIVFITVLKKPEARIKWITSIMNKGTITQDITATGSLEAKNTISVGTQISGIIEKIEVDFNDKVTTGQLLAVVDYRN